MISLRTLLLIGYGCLVIALALRSLRAQRLKERYVLLFLFIGLPFLLLGFWPDGIVLASKWLGMEKPTIMVLALAGFLILVIFQLLSIVSVQDRRITSLTQEVGLLREELRSGPPRETMSADATQDEGDVEDDTSSAA